MGDTFILPDRTRAPPRSKTADSRNKNKKKKVVKDWELYMVDESLEENWKRFLHDLGLGDFKSKAQCKKALQGKWVNIRDFLTLVQQRNAAAQSIVDDKERDTALQTPIYVHFFPSERALSEYTIKSKKIFPRKYITKESPLKLLLASIL